MLLGSRTLDHLGVGGWVEVLGGVGLVDLRVLVHLYLPCCCLFLLFLLRLGCHALLGSSVTPLRLRTVAAAGRHGRQLNYKRAAIVRLLIHEERYLLIGASAEIAVAESWHNLLTAADSGQTPPFDSGLGRLMEPAEAVQLELDYFVLD